MKESEDPKEPLISTNSEEIIITSNNEGRIESTQESFNDNIEQIDQEKVQMDLIDLKAECTNVKSVLKLKNLKQSNNYNLVKFSIKVKAVYDYQWEIYRTPNKIKENFSQINSELSEKNIPLSNEIKNIFNTVDEIQEPQIGECLNNIENYYKIFFRDTNIKNCLILKEFFNISSGSFNQYNNGIKPFEGYCYIKSHQSCFEKLFSCCICNCVEKLALSGYNKKWIVVKEDCIYYMDNSNSQNGKNVYFFDNKLEINKISDLILKLKNINRFINIKFETFFELEMLFNEIKKYSEKMKENLKKNLYSSYTNEKKNNIVHWFSDGEEYFKDLKNKLLEAKESIFITDWFMSPELFLERPVNTKTYLSMKYQNKLIKDTPPYNRLIDILNNCANHGVKINILLYNESLVLKNSINSEHTQNLLSLNSNIQIIRHSSLKNSLWSHHEKLVIIDQIIAYVGGLDLCWGRFDTNEHPIYEMPNSDEIYYFPGIDYSNARSRDFENLNDYLLESVDRNTMVRMPWHDVHTRLTGPVVADITRHFVERWHFSKKIGNTITDIKPSSDAINDENNNDKNDKNDKKDNINNNNSNNINTVNNTNNINDNIINNNVNNNNNNNALLPNEEDDFNFEDYINTTQFKRNKKKNKKNNQKSTEDNTDSNNKESEDINTNINTTDNKMDIPKIKSYQEEYIYKSGLTSEKESLNNDYLTKKNKTELPLLKNKIKDNNTTQKKPKFYKKLINKIAKNHNNEEKGWFYNLFHTEENQIIQKIPNVNFFQKGIKSRVQVLRSVSEWSIGTKKKEKSILNAYYRLIDNSKHYLYIENQFFISCSFDKEEKEECGNNAISDKVKNLIAFHIKKRIERAYLSNEKFRVFIFIPLLPGFAGEVEDTPVMQITMKHTYAGICRNYGISIIESLEKIMGDKWKNYITFLSLRGHGVMNNKPVTELIYIHSKLMIVDDKSVIIGSANINDRSMLGDRDSEYCVLINEDLKLNSKMNEKDYMAAEFAVSFRKHLFSEHFGIEKNNDILNDPLSDDLWNLCQKTAENNTVIYRNVFGCYPDDNYKTFKELKERKKFDKMEEIEELREKYEKEIKGIVGHVVEFPLHFLENENLGIKFYNLENVLPEITYT